MLLCLVLSLLLATGNAVAAESFIIARDGRPAATIVTAADIEKPFDDGIRNPAVRDLIRVVALMSASDIEPGAALPVVNEEVSFANDVPQIHIGLTEFVRNTGLIPDSLPRNGYRIVTTHENGYPRLVIAGSTPLGTSHGVYDLLSRELGVVWGMGHPLFEEIPQRRTVEVGSIDRTETPAFASRAVSGADSDWPRRMRLDQSQTELPYMRHGHNVANIITRNEFADNPEYWAYHDGRYKQPERWPHPRSMICPTHPDVIRITIDKVRKYFDEHPEVLGYSLCGADTDEWCTCERCATLDAGLAPVRGNPQYSDSYFSWVDTVARAILETHPDRYVSAYGYDTTERPPRRDNPLPPNVVVYLTQDGTQHFDSAFAAYEDSLIAAWSEVAHNIAIYEYGNLGWYIPRNPAHLMADRIAALPALSVKAYYSEIFPHWPLMAPFLYTSAQVMWDTDTDVDAALGAWYASMFHEAADEMQAFYETLEAAWMNADRPGYWMGGRARMWEQLAAWPPEYRELSRDQLASARAVATSDIVRRRLDYVARGFDVAYAASVSFDAVHSLNAQSDEATIRAAIGLFDDFLALYHANIESDPTYHDTYYRGHKPHELFKWLKWDLYDGVSRVTTDRRELFGKLLRDEPTLTDAYNTITNRRMAGYLRWTERGIEHRGVWPTWIERANSALER